MTNPPVQLAEIDLTSLASTYGVLRTTPAYPQVKAAIDRLAAAEADGTDYPDKVKDIDVVRDFADLLRTSQSLLARAIVAGALIGRAAQGQTRADEVSLGLRILRERFREALDARSHAVTAQRRIIDAAREIWGLDKGSLPTVASLYARGRWPKALARFEAAVGDALSEVHEGLKSTHDFRDRIDEPAWRSVATRIATYLTNGTAVHQSHEEYVKELYACAALGPDALPRADVSTLSVQEWSREATLLAVSQDSKHRLIIAHLAATALGFSGLRIAQADENKNSAPRGRDFELIANAQTAFERRLKVESTPAFAQPVRAVVLMTAPLSRLPAFTPRPQSIPSVAVSSEIAATWQTASQSKTAQKKPDALRSVERLLKSLPADTSVRLAIEVEQVNPQSRGSTAPGIDQGSASELQRFLQQATKRSLDYVFLYGFDPGSEKVLTPPVMMPRELTDLIQNTTPPPS